MLLRAEDESRFSEWDSDVRPLSTRFESTHDLGRSTSGGAQGGAQGDRSGLRTGFVESRREAQSLPLSASMTKTTTPPKKKKKAKQRLLQKLTPSKASGGAKQRLVVTFGSGGGRTGVSLKFIFTVTFRANPAHNHLTRPPSYI